ncbi:glycosyltransferase [Lactobacillus sp. YT155]|uniref:glycosyltransferase family 2 protein n=1 Tax=Lactobacillus sp. YT155 TaxID=3060955 RepID=UPI00265EA47C|nr:glycosyltransferase [Lactobacillus sp. YT155]MDO1605764.1 glycosyltransferase [Lactobacillus sp. YT155]
MNKEDYIFTVVMPIYNAEEYLKKSLDSFVDQSFKDFQLIMIDDQSSDDSVAICEQYTKEYENFKLIQHKENQGVSAARNTGIHEANSQYITFVDSDDWVDPEYLAFFVEAFEENDIDLACCGFMVETDKNSKQKGIFKNTGAVVDRNELLKRIISANGSVMGYAWNKAYKLELIKKNDLSFATDVNLMEDAIFNVQYVSTTDNFYYSTKPLYHYYQRKNSTSHNYFAINNIKDVSVANFRIHKQIIQNMGEQLDLDTNSKKK